MKHTPKGLSISRASAICTCSTTWTGPEKCNTSVRPSWTKPRTASTPHGIYASRHPCRPNSIGMSIVRLISREENVFTVEGVDMLDQTPLLDIKPYMP